MENKVATAVFESLASGIRLDIFRLLVKQVPTGMVAGDIAMALELPATNLSFHLKALTQAQLLTVTQEGRFQRYRANVVLIQDLIRFLTAECCSATSGQCLMPGGINVCASAVLGSSTMQSPEFTNPGDTKVTTKVINVLFLCTHNSARSILAEAILNHISKGRFKAFSAGSSPGDDQQPNPLGLQVLQAAGISTEGLRSKSWDEFGKPDAPHMDLVITVCDNAAGEVCPFWPGQPATAHWGYPDPSAGEGSDTQKLEAFRQTLYALNRRLELLINLPPEKLQKSMLQSAARNMALVA